jgi:hypothetical protein
MNNFLANFEHTLTDDDVEMIAREQFPDPDIHLPDPGLMAANTVRLSTHATTQS